MECVSERSFWVSHSHSFYCCSISLFTLLSPSLSFPLFLSVEFLSRSLCLLCLIFQNFIVSLPSLSSPVAICPLFQLPLRKWRFESIQLTRHPALLSPPPPSVAFFLSFLCLTSSPRISFSYHHMKGIQTVQYYNNSCISFYHFYYTFTDTSFREPVAELQPLRTHMRLICTYLKVLQL